MLLQIDEQCGIKIIVAMEQRLIPMKSIHHDSNRAVHLGRRDAFMDKASQVFRRCLNESSRNRRAQLTQATLYYLQAALDHSSMAAKSDGSIREEGALVLVIRTLVYYLHSAMVIMENETKIRNKESALWQFLHGHGESHAAADLARSSKQLLEDASRFFRICEAPYARLKRTIMENMNEREIVRYNKALDSLRKHIALKTHQRHVTSYGRTSCQVPVAKYE